MGEHPDLKLLRTETPQQQVDRMGAGWWNQEQYEKQLELPVHMIAPGGPTPSKVKREGVTGPIQVYKTNCGLILGDVTMRSTDDPEDVTCAACGPKRNVKSPHSVQRKGKLAEASA